MSEVRPFYIHCASGHNVFTDLHLRRKGGLIEVTAPPCFDLTPDDAEKMADALREIAFQIRYAELKQPTTTLQA